MIRERTLGSHLMGIEMKIPKQQKRYCVKCKKHTLQKVDLAKRKPRSTLARGQRRFLRKMKGYGSFPKENPKGREKATRKLDLRFTCTVCNKKQIIGQGFRTKKVEWIKEQ